MNREQIKELDELILKQVRLGIALNENLSLIVEKMNKIKEES